MKYPVANPTVVFKEAHSASLQERDLSQPEGEDYVLIETEKSIVSAGTELACLRGTESWAPFPFVPGYGSVGRIVDTGPAVEGLSVGDRIFTYGRHERYSLANTVITPVPEGLSPEAAVFTRIAAVAMTARRVSDAEYGDPVLVIGLGLVGNLAAQIFKGSGAEVAVVDPSDNRRCLAAACGIPATFASQHEVEKEMDALTDGKRFRTVVDATGIPAVIESALRLAGKNGEVILLGSPRGEHKTDLTPFLNYIHLARHGCVTLKGAHEFRFPADEHPDQAYRHSFASNVKLLLHKIAAGELRVRDLLSHQVNPADVGDLYSKLNDGSESMAGVVLDWT